MQECCFDDDLHPCQRRVESPEQHFAGIRDMCQVTYVMASVIFLWTAASSLISRSSSASTQRLRAQTQELFPAITIYYD